LLWSAGRYDKAETSSERIGGGHTISWCSIISVSWLTFKGHHERARESALSQIFANSPKKRGVLYRRAYVDAASRHKEAGCDAGWPGRKADPPAERRAEEEETPAVTTTGVSAWIAQKKRWDRYLKLQRRRLSPQGSEAGLHGDQKGKFGSYPRA